MPDFLKKNLFEAFSQTAKFSVLVTTTIDSVNFECKKLPIIPTRRAETGANYTNFARKHRLCSERLIASVINTALAGNLNCHQVVRKGFFRETVSAVNTETLNRYRIPSAAPARQIERNEFVYWQPFKTRHNNKISFSCKTMFVVQAYFFLIFTSVSGF